MPNPDGKVRYAVVGAGNITQVAVLPAFEHAENCELVALVSGDAQKRSELSRLHRIPRVYSYEQYDDCLRSGGIDSVYLALPNHLHCDYAIRAARAGIHVLCEKPLAVTAEECEAMIRACRDAGVKLMAGYRLHFEESNLEAIRIALSGEIGEPRFFSSDFAQQVPAGNARVAYDVGHGGGPVYDMGVYCINAARYLFRAEPVEVTAFSGHTPDPRFELVDEMTSVILRFPGDRLATFTCSFGAVDTCVYELTGTRGRLRMEPGYFYVGEIKMQVTVGEDTRERVFAARDQFAPELIHFAGCIRSGREPEPSGEEGLADVRVVEAIYRSAASRRPVALEPFERAVRPDPSLAMYRPPVAFLSRA